MGMRDRAAVSYSPIARHASGRRAATAATLILEKNRSDIIQVRPRIQAQGRQGRLRARHVQNSPGPDRVSVATQRRKFPTRAVATLV